MKKRKKRFVWLWSLAFVMAALFCVVCYALHYMTQVINIASFSQLLYTLKAGASGAENTTSEIIRGFFVSYGPWLLMLLGLWLAGLKLYALADSKVRLQKAQSNADEQKPKTETACAPAKEFSNEQCLISLCDLQVWQLDRDFGQNEDLYETWQPTSMSFRLDQPFWKRVRPKLTKLCALTMQSETDPASEHKADKENQLVCQPVYPAFFHKRPSGLHTGMLKQMDQKACADHAAKWQSAFLPEEKPAAQTDCLRPSSSLDPGPEQPANLANMAYAANQTESSEPHSNQIRTAPSRDQRASSQKSAKHVWYHEDYFLFAPWTWSKVCTALSAGCIVFALSVTSALAARIHTGWKDLGISEYLKNQNTYSDLYETWYVSPEEVSITFPQQKKNLVYIFLESMESTYANVYPERNWSELQHPKAPVNLIPKLSALALKEGESFCQDGMLQGARVASQCTWTVAGMVAQTSGTPLALPNKYYDSKFDPDQPFLPNLTTLGEILEDNGYSNHMIMGSESCYAGRANYFQQHGNYDIYDLNRARSEGTLPEDYRVWWGYEDSKLFDYAKIQLSQAAEQAKTDNQNFSFTMLSADTHFTGGYLCPDCPDTYDEQMENVFLCSDKRVAQFIDWMKQQDFWDDTVVILSGDHLSMDALIRAITPPDQERTTFFTILNGPESVTGQARDYTTLDLFATTLGALGADIEGNRLGLGTNLYSDTPTLSEVIGFDTLTNETAMQSAYFEDVILGEPAEQSQSQ